MPGSSIGFVSSLPPIAASCKGVLPSLDLALTSVLLASSNAATSLQPLNTAQCKGVLPVLSLALTAALPASSNAAT